MAQQTINIGAAPNDGTGTPLRTSFDYTNQNFTELYTALGGGVGLPGATTQVIFNDGGTNLAGDAGLTYNKTTDALTVVGALSGSKLTVTGGTIPANGVYLPAANTLEFAANSLAQYRIAPLGVFSWYDGAGGTRMTLNSSGLLVGASASGTGEKLNVFGTIVSSAQSLGTFAANQGGFDFNVTTKNLRIYAGTTNATASSMSFVAGTSASFVTAATIDGVGNLLVGVASANANGGVLQLKSGITFPATQVAATDVNTLDDYEEGTFTPTIVGGTTAGVGTYAVQKGNYTKVGNLVFFNIYVGTSAHTGTGDMLIGALPFTSNATSNQFNSVTLGQVNNLALSASNVATAIIVSNSTQIAIQQYPVGGGAATQVPIDPASFIICSGFYMV